MMFDNKVKKYSRYRRARKDNYRISFKVNENVVYIGRIEDRSNAYN